MAKKTENRPNVTTTYSSGDAMDADLRPGRAEVKKVPTDIEAAKRHTASVGETPVNPPAKGVNDPS